LIFENHIKFHKIPGMSEEAKTYDETLDELEKLLEKEEKKPHLSTPERSPTPKEDSRSNERQSQHRQWRM